LHLRSIMNNRIQAIKGDITKIKVDVIVNAANSSLLGGGGVDGAIHRAGGLAILQECKKIVAAQGGCKTGEAVITNAGNLQAKYVIHTVGPIWNGGKNDERNKLANCYLNSLHLAVEHDLKTIAFPNISTGVYGFPKKDAADISVSCIQNFILNNSSIEQVIIVCFDEQNYQFVSNKLNC